jgi:hypothetical protein
VTRPTPRRRLKCEESETFFSYIGTSDELLTAGIIPEVGLLPGHASRPKTRVAYDQHWQQRAAADIDRDATSYAIHVRGKTRYEVLCYRSREDTAKLRAQKKIADSIRALPGCKEQFRYRTQCRVEKLLSEAIDAIGEACGYRFARPAYSAFQAAMLDGLEALANGKIEAAPDDRALAVARISARLDPEYRRFMARASSLTENQL